MPSEWEGKPNPSLWGDVMFGSPVQVKQGARTQTREGQRGWKLNGSEGRAGSSTSGKRERILLCFCSMSRYQPQCQPSLRGDLQPWEVAGYEPQALVTKKSWPAVLRPLPPSPTYNPEILLLLYMDVGGWVRGPSCLVLPPGPMPRLQIAIVCLSWFAPGPQRSTVCRRGAQP